LLYRLEVYYQMDGDEGDANRDDQQEDRQTRATGSLTDRTCLRKHEIRHDRFPVAAELLSYNSLS
jgi:hypothetical protein